MACNYEDLSVIKWLFRKKKKTSEYWSFQKRPVPIGHHVYEVVIPTTVSLTYLSLLLVLFSVLASFHHFRSCLRLSSSRPHFGLCLIRHFRFAWCFHFRFCLMASFWYPTTCSPFISCLVSSFPILPHALLLNITTCPFGSHHMPLMLSFEVLPHTLLSFISCLVILQW